MPIQPRDRKDRPDALRYKAPVQQDGATAKIDAAHDRNSMMKKNNKNAHDQTAQAMVDAQQTRAKRKTA